MHVTGAYADNALTGNGLQEQRLLAADYSSAYTTPDTTNNKATFVNATVRQRFTSQSAPIVERLLPQHSHQHAERGHQRRLARSVRLSAQCGRHPGTDGRRLYWVSGGRCNAANTPFPFWRCIAQALQRDEPGEKCDGLLNRTTTTQDNYGVSGQVDARTSGGATNNRFTAGGGFDWSTVSFGQSSQLGYLSPDRSVTAVPGAFADGISGGNVDGRRSTIAST